jgi:hypothetical protein
MRNGVEAARECLGSCGAVEQHGCRRGNALECIVWEEYNSRTAYRRGSVVVNSEYSVQVVFKC